MNTKLATSQIRLKNWAAIIQDRKQSGLSVNDYCSQHQLSRDAYYYWLRKIKKTCLWKAALTMWHRQFLFQYRRSSLLIQRK